MSAPIGGDAEPGFGPVRTTFARLFETGAETGAALAVTYRGRLVVDLYGGWRDAARERPWAPDTLVNTFSVGKPLAALCVLMLVDRGQLGLDDPVATHWPGFTATEVTVRHVLTHTAGLPAFPAPRPVEALADWQLLASDLASIHPQWTPGTVAAEHALTYGHLAGELVRHVDGRSLGRYLSEEIAVPWRLDLGFGLDENNRRRCAELEYGVPHWPRTALGEPGSLRARAMGNPAGYLELDVLNSALWRGAEIPAVNLHATAGGLARLYLGLLAGGVLDGVRLLDPGTVAEAVRVQYQGPDLLLDRPVRWTLGMQVDDDGSWGMGGIGGSVGYADPARDYTFAYVTRRLADSDRVDVLADAVNRATEG
jgi:CubicO group peptidase (beta-lactamase class C family)